MSEPSRGPNPIVVALCVGVVFLVLAAANSGGYRYGASDQAFYIPAVHRHLDPSLFPRDRGLLDEQAQLLWLDDVAGWLGTHAGVTVPAMFAAGFVAAGVILGASLWWLARGFGLGAFGALAFVLGMTLRHRVAETGVNTFEGYFHPRVLAFAFGIASVAAAIGNRTIAAFGLVLVALLVHPTTGAWFAGWLTVAAVAEHFERHPERWPPCGTRRFAAACALVAIAATILLFLATRGGALAEQLEPMDPAWRSVLASKRYLFPDLWRASSWAPPVASAAILVGGLLWRRRSRLVAPGESGIVIGCLALLAVFLVTMPFVIRGMALFVQLQISRVLWPVETMATLYLVWLLTEASWSAPGKADAPRTTRAGVVLLLVGAAALGRGVYVTGIERPERKAIQYSLPHRAWTEVLDWARRETPRDAFFLADPGHAWKYAISFRVGALRDVYLEEVKDAAMAMYSRPNAERVLRRLRALGSFAELTPARLDALVAEFGLTHLVRERVDRVAEPCFGRAVLWQNDRFVVCDLAATLPRR